MGCAGPFGKDIQDFPSWRDKVAGVLSDLAYPPFWQKCLPLGWTVSEGL